MLNRIKDFIFEKDNGTLTQEELSSRYEAVRETPVDIQTCSDPAAHGFYCPNCKMGFKTKAATSVHKRYKHGK